MNLSCGQCQRIQPFSGEPLRCEVCGWSLSQPTLDKQQQRRKQTDKSSALMWELRQVVGCFGILIAIGVALGGLWLLVALIKWMWQHS